MTKKEAKELSLKVWRYLAEHPEITRNHDLPGEFYYAIRNLTRVCPLCEMFFTVYSFGCPGCPLSKGEDYCCTPGQPYYRWGKAASAKERKEAAEEMVRMIEAWEVEE